MIDSKILTQLVLVKLEHNHEEVAIPLEELLNPDDCPRPEELEAQARAKEEAAQRLLEDTLARARESQRQSGEKSKTAGAGDRKKRRRRRRSRKPGGSDNARQETAPPPTAESGGTDTPKKKRRRRRRRRGGGGQGPSGGAAGASS